MSETGWPPPVLCQDACRGLFQWFAERANARQHVRDAVQAIIDDR